MRIAVFGLGYVGSVSAACLARDGHEVIGVDVDRGKVDRVNAGDAPVEEPGLSELLEQQTREGRLRATLDGASAVKRTDVSLITVGTPSRSDGSVDFSIVVDVARSIGEALSETRSPHSVIVRSTVLPGVLEDHVIPVLEASSGERIGERIRVGNHPEFLRETTALRDYDDPPFILVGTGDPVVAEQVDAFYPRTDAERIVTDSRTAAMVKYACNALHALKVDFANEIGVLAGELGADGREVMRIACLDRQLNISPAYLRPGFAFGGSCLPKDVRALARFAQTRAIRAELLESILPSNEAHLRRGLDRVLEIGSRNIGLLGLSFKSGTDDLRESPQVWLAEQLLGRGYELRIFDPDVSVSRLVGQNQAYVERHLPHLARLLAKSLEDVLHHAELLILGTNIADRVNWQELYQGDVLDLRNDLVRPAQLQRT